MFTQGKIIYFSPFYFKNGNTSKNKYFIVLKSSINGLVIASLPTRSVKAQSLMDVTHGCINVDDRCFNCYAFEANKVIADTGFSFPIATYVYGNEVETYEIEILTSNYLIENIDYEIKGTLLQEEFTNLYNCIKNSNSIKRGIKRLL